MPQVEGAFVSMDPHDGAIKSLVGGFDFNRNHFNRVTMAGVSLAPASSRLFIQYGLERGFTPSSMINDAPLVIDPQSIGGQRWEPKTTTANLAA